MSYLYVYVPHVFLYIIVNTIKNLPLDPFKRASVKDIFEEVELVFTGDEVLARNLINVSLPEIVRRKIKRNWP